MMKFFLAFATVFVAIIAIILFAYYERKKEDENDSAEIIEEKNFRLKYWSVTINNFGDYAPSQRTHNRVFSRLNYEFINASNGDDWDILWSHESPFSSDKNHSHFKPLQERKLLPHQKISHFPGISYLVSKSNMNFVNRHHDFVLPSFDLPDDKEKFDDYVKKNPQKKILEKNFYNRGVKIVDVKDVKEQGEEEEVFYQEFMDNPFLIDGHAFDFGVFVLITSFDPIRAYRFDEVLLRFCAKEYHPFDADDRDKYVVKDGSIPVYEMPSFADDYKNFKLSAKSMFESLIKERGFDVEEFWKKIDRAIGTAVMNAEGNVIKKLISENVSSHHLFEVVRFDIILDENLKPFVVEVNMSPNLTPASERYEENSLTYEQLIYNVVKMIGGSSHHEFHSRFDSTDSIVSNYKNLATAKNFCKNECENCKKTFCQICHPCMSSDVRYQLSEAFREHQNSANFKRVFPTENYFNDAQEMTEKNQIQMKWFEEKCKENKKWC